METIDFQHLNIQPGQTVLDVGCGEGRHTIACIFHQPDSNCIALDLSFNDLLKAKSKHNEFDLASSQRCVYAQANGYRLPFPDRSIDHIICSEVLEHVQDYGLMLDELTRVLKPGGSLTISVPRFWPEKICWNLSRAYHEVEGGHIRIFRADALKVEILKRDLRFKFRHWAHSLHAPYWWLRCAFWSRGENFFPCRWYHKFLVWDLLKRPILTRVLEKLLNPVCGKSVVMYFEKSGL